MKQTFFEVKKEHLMLLRRANVWWNDAEFGAPGIYPKKPYGNSCVYTDMVNILGAHPAGEGVFVLNLFSKDYVIYGKDNDNLNVENRELIRVLDTLHKETEIVLQIILSTGIFSVGVYRLKSEYGCEWEKVE